MVKIKLKQNLKTTQKGYLSLESKLFIKLIKLNIDEINDLLEKELLENLVDRGFFLLIDLRLKKRLMQQIHSTKQTMHSLNLEDPLSTTKKVL